MRTSTLRYYEQIGLMPAPPRAGGQRRYDGEHLRRAHMLVAARRLGFSVRALLSMIHAPRERLNSAALLRSQRLHAEAAAISRQAEHLERLAACDCGSPIACPLLAEME